MVKFLQTSDWQIGMKGSGLGVAGSLVAEQRIQTLERILQVAEAESADFVVACGDLFEHNQVADDQVTGVARILRAHPSVEIHAIPGNHDLPGPGSVWNRAALRGVPNLRIHLSPDPCAVLGKDGSPVILHPLPVRSRYSYSDPLAQIVRIDGGPEINVGLGHGHLTTISFGAHEGDIKLPIDPAHVDRIGLDYLALGHWHGTKVLKATDGAPRIAYSGTHEQTAYAETNAGNVLVVTIPARGAGPDIRAVRVGVLRWEERQLAFAGDQSLERLAELLANCEADFLELSVAGELPGHLFTAYRQLLESDRFKHVRLHDESLSWLPDKDGTTLELSDASLRMVHEQLNTALAGSSGAEAAIAREALALFERYVREAGL
jgi:predicted phosphodiesterase